MPVAPLPDLTALDAAALRDMIVRQQQQISWREQEVEHLQEQIASHGSEIERLRLIIARLQRLQFGRKSEKIQRQLDQLELQLEDLEARTAEEQYQAKQTRPDAVSVKAPARKERRALPEHLPREVQTHEPQHEGCPACGGQLSKLGEDISEVLEYVPARFKVIRHVRPKLSCTRCDAIVQAEAPSRPIDRGLAGPGLLAHVLVSKYADHLPL